MTNPSLNQISLIQAASTGLNE